MTTMSGSLGFSIWKTCCQGRPYVCVALCAERGCAGTRGLLPPELAVVVFTGLPADCPGWVGIQLSGLGQAALGIASLGPPSKGELGGRRRGQRGSPPWTTRSQVPFKDLEIVSALGTAEGSLPITKPNSSFEVAAGETQMPGLYPAVMCRVSWAVGWGSQECQVPGDLSLHCVVPPGVMHTFRRTLPSSCGTCGCSGPWGLRACPPFTCCSVRTWRGGRS